MEKILSKNRKAFHDYEILETFEAGIVLFGHEVKSLKTHGPAFPGSFISEENGELFLKKLHIPLYERATLAEYLPERPRKLLMRKAEIQKIAGALSTKGVTVVPLSCGLKKGIVKLEIALVRGKKNFDKRENLKKRDQDRRIKATLKHY